MGLLLNLSGGGFPGPTALAGKKVWYKADSLALNDGDPVATWVDSFGTGNDLTAAGAARPTFKTNIQAGRPVTRWDGSGNKMSTASVAGTNFVAANAGTVWLVYSQTNAAGSIGPVSWGTSSVTNAFQLFGAHSDNNLYYDHGDETGNAARISAAQPGGWDNAFHVVELYRSGATMSITIDGTVLVTSGAISDDLDPSSSSPFWVGSVDMGSTPTGACDIAEVVLSNIAESATNRLGMKRYLARKYLITVV